MLIDGVTSVLVVQRPKFLVLVLFNNNICLQQKVLKIPRKWDALVREALLFAL